MNDRVKALLLDFGGVVIKTPFEFLDVTERRFGLPPRTLDWHGPFAPERDELWQRMQRGEISERDYWAARSEEAGRAAGAHVTWSTREFMNEHYRCDESAFVRPEAIDAIRAARAAGLTVAVLTNDLAAFHGAQWYPSLAVSKLIDHVTDASLTGVLKPDPGAYRLALAELGLSSEQVIFVDDQPHNVRGAEAAGLRAIWFDVTQPQASFERALEAAGVSIGVSKDRSIAAT